LRDRWRIDRAIDGGIAGGIDGGVSGEKEGGINVSEGHLET
jgi:hypothetical protein